jgi:hypothetical protein
MDACATLDERIGKRTVKPCGPDVSTLTSTGDDALHHAGMVTRKPDHQGEHGTGRKTVAQGMPDCLADLR